MNNINIYLVNDKGKPYRSRVKINGKYKTVDDYFTMSVENFVKIVNLANEQKMSFNDFIIKIFIDYFKNNPKVTSKKIPITKGSNLIEEI